MQSATVVTIGVRKVAVGLTWRALPGLSSQSKEIAQYASELGMRHGVVVESDDSTLVGLSPLTEKLPSGAAWVAAGSKGESIVLLEPVGDSHCWVCAVRNGCPQPEFDIVLPIDEVPGALDRLAGISAFKVATRHFDGADLDIDFEGIIEGKKANQVRQLIGIPKSVKLAIGGVIGVTVLGAVWYNYSEEQAKLQAQADLAAFENQNAQAAKQSAEAQRQMAIKAIEDTVRAVVTSAPSAQDSVSSWLDVIGPLPMIAASWKIKNIDCALTSCNVLWTRHKTGTTEGFMALAKANGWKITNYGINDLSITLPVTIPARNGDPHAVPSESVTKPALLTSMQTLALIGIDGVIKDATEPAAAIQPAPANSTQAPNGAPVTSPAGFTSPWRIGDLSLTGKRFFEIRGIPEYLNRDHISIGSLKFNGDTNVWTMEGKYAVK